MFWVSGYRHVHDHPTVSASVSCVRSVKNRNRVAMELRVSQSSAQYEYNHPCVIAIIVVTLYQVEWHHVNEKGPLLESSFC